MNIHDVFQEIYQADGSKNKVQVLKKHKDNKLLKRVIKMAYDIEAYKYHITMKNIKYCSEGIYSTGMGMELEQALDTLEQKFCTEEVTGNAAISVLENLLESLSEKDASLVEKIIDRNLKIRLQAPQINKVWPNLIDKPSYCRCDIYNEKTSKDIDFPAMLQLKEDGTYREFNVQNGEIICRSRSGEFYEYPSLFEEFKGLPDGYYIGELTVQGIPDRHEANGLINSDNPPQDDIIVKLWDYVSEDEYVQAGLRDRKNPCKTKYEVRWNQLIEALSLSGGTRTQLVDHVMVDNIQEALKITSQWMKEGKEGAILKDLKKMVFKDGTSKYQLKLKLEIELEVRCTGFTKGAKNTRREQWFGAMMFETDDKSIKGQCSGFNDKQLKEFTPIQDELIGQVFTVKCTDITKAKGNDFYALSYPQFVEWRTDRTTTDDFERAMKQRDSAMMLS